MNAANPTADITRVTGMSGHAARYMQNTGGIAKCIPSARDSDLLQQTGWWDRPVMGTMVRLGVQPSTIQQLSRGRGQAGGTF